MGTFDVRDYTFDDILVALRPPAEIGKIDSGCVTGSRRYSSACGHLLAIWVWHLKEELGRLA